MLCCAVLCYVVVLCYAVLCYIVVLGYDVLCYVVVLGYAVMCCFYRSSLTLQPILALNSHQA